MSHEGHQSTEADDGRDLPHDPNTPYDLADVLHPASINGDVEDVAKIALDQFIDLLITVVGYGEAVEGQVRNNAYDEAFSSGIPEGQGVAPGRWADGAYELAAVARGNKAIGMALELVQRARLELDKPVVDRRRA